MLTPRPRARSVRRRVFVGAVALCVSPGCFRTEAVFEVASQDDGDQGTEAGGGDASGVDDRTGNDGGGPTAGFWVALAADCQTATSVDGITWQPQASYPATSRCSQVLWAGGLYLGTNQSA